MAEQKALGAHREYFRNGDGSWQVRPWDGKDINEKAEALMEFLDMRGGIPMSTELALTSIAITLKQLLRAYTAQRREVDAIVTEREPGHYPRHATEPTHSIPIPAGMTEGDLIDLLREKFLGGDRRGWRR